LLSMATSRRTGGGSAQPALDVNPVVSSYGGILFSLTNLVGLDDAWKASGGGSAKERLAYLRLLTRVLHHKNPDMRKVLPRSDSSSDWRSQRAIAQQRHHGAGSGGGGPGGPGRWRERGGVGERRRDGDGDGSRFQTRRTAPQHSRLSRDESAHSLRDVLLSKDGSAISRERVDSSDEVAKKKKPAPPRRPNE
jgi:hypothetical protein